MSRRPEAGLHDLYELLTIALWTLLCGSQGAVDVALSANAKEPFLCNSLKLENGLPRHNTFSRLFRNLEPDQFRASFQRFMTQFSDRCQDVVAIEAKVFCRFSDRASGESVLHMISALGCEQRLVLVQMATDAKSNAITAAPQLLEMLMLKSAILTADAFYCRRVIAE